MPKAEHNVQECREGAPAKPGVPIWAPGVAAHAFDKEGEERLWALSKRLTGLA